MKTSDDMIHDIAEWLGDYATRKDAELLFDHLRANGMMPFDEQYGFALAEDVDLFAEYEKAAFAAGLATKVDAL